MEAIPHEFERSLRRSTARLRVFLAALSLGQSYVGQLARAAGVRRSRVMAALYGQMPAYSVSSSLVALGLVRVVEREGSRVVEITTKGRRKARSITAAWARRGRGASTRERLATVVHVAGHLAPVTGTGEGPGGGSPDPPTDTWTATVTFTA